jgi:hypothetical protein
MGLLYLFTRKLTGNNVIYDGLSKHSGNLSIKIFSVTPSFHRTVGAGSFPGVKRSGRGVDHPPASSAEVENE